MDAPHKAGHDEKEEPSCPGVSRLVRGIHHRGSRFVELLQHGAYSNLITPLRASCSYSAI